MANRQRQQLFSDSAKQRILEIQVVDLVMCKTHCADLVEDEFRTVCNAASRESHFGEVRLW